MSGLTMISTDSAQDVTKALGMYKAQPANETQTNSAPAAEATTAEPAGETSLEVTEPSTESTDASSNQDVVEADQTQDADTQAVDKNAGKDKKGGFQRRIDKLTKARSQAELERDFERTEKLKLAKELDDLRIGKTQAGAQQTQNSAAQNATDQEPNPEQFETVREYLKAQTRWEIKQEQKKSELVKKTSEAKDAFQSKIQDFHKKVGDFKKTTADYDDVAAEFDEAYPSGMPNTVLDVISESDHGPQIMYDLAKDHAEFERVSKLPPLSLAREIGRREARLSTNSGENQNPKPKTTGAPAPMVPVKGAAAVNTKDPGNMSMREYNAWRDAGGGR